MMDHIAVCNRKHMQVNTNIHTYIHVHTVHKYVCSYTYMYVRMPVWGISVNSELCNFSFSIKYLNLQT